jgi:hypothetical protein
MKQSYDTTSFDKLIILIFIEVSKNDYLELRSNIGHIHFTVRNIQGGRQPPIDMLWSNDINTRSQILWNLSIQTFNFQELLSNMQVKLVLVIFQNNLIIIMNSITFLFVFKTTNGLKRCCSGSKWSQLDLIARVVFVSAGFGCLDIAVRIDMQQLHLISVFNEFSFSILK